MEGGEIAERPNRSSWPVCGGEGGREREEEREEGEEDVHRRATQLRKGNGLGDVGRPLGSVFGSMTWVYRSMEKS